MSLGTAVAARRTAALPRFDLLFPTSTGPDLAGTGARCAAWTREMGLTDGRERPEECVSRLHAEGAARSCRGATGRDLDLATRVCAWAALVGGRFDSLASYDRAQVERLCWELTEATLRSPRLPAHSRDPFVRAWHQLWVRQCEGMSPVWQQRAGRDWNGWFAARAAAAQRSGDEFAEVEAYLRFRRIAVPVHPFVGLLERVRHFEVPARALSSEPLRELLDLTADVVALTNDVVALPEEERTGCGLNSVLVLRRSLRWGRQAAVEEVHRRIHAATHRFAHTRTAVAAMGDRLALSPYEREAVRRCAAGCGTFLGTYACRLPRVAGPVWAPDRRRCDDGAASLRRG